MNVSRESLNGMTPLASAEAQPVSERLLRAIADHSQDIVMVLRADGTIAYQNLQVERLLGYAASELIGLDLFDFIHPDEVADVRLRLRRVVVDAAHSAQCRAQLQLRKRNGEWRWFECIGTNLLDDQAVNGILLNLRDITERRLAEQTLEDSERRFETALWGGNIAYWDWDLVTDTGAHSAQWFELTGWTPEQFYVGRHPWLGRVHPEDRPEIERSVAQVVEGSSEFVEFEYRIACADGNWRWLLDRGRVAERDPSGKPTRLIGTSIDIDARKRMEEALRQSEFRYRTVTEFAQGFVQEFEIRPDGTSYLRWVGDGFERILGVTLEQVREAGGWQMFYPADELPSARERRNRLLKGEQTDAVVRVINARGEERWLHMINRPVRDHASGYVTVIGVVHDITERKLTEEQFAASMEQVRLALEHAPIAVAMMTLDGRPVRVNRKLCELLRRSREELLGLDNLASVTQPEDRTRDLALVQELLSGRRTFFQHEKTLVRADGADILCRSSVSIIPDTHGRPQLLLEQIEDVSPQRTAEAALRKSESLLRSVTQSVPDSLMLIDLELRIQFANRAIDDVEPAALVGRPIFDFLPAAEHDSVRAVYERAIATRVPQAYEYRQQVDNEARWFEHRIGPVLEDGRIVALTVASSEVTIRRRGEEALRTQARILDAMREGVVVSDNDGIIRLINRSMSRLTGYEPHELIGRHLRMITERTEAEFREVELEVARRLKESEHCAREFECVRRDGSRFTAGIVITRIQIGGISHRMGVVENITERRELEREIIEIANREQRRIGNDLHDGLGQELTGVALMLRGLVGRLQKERSPSTAAAEEIVALVNSAIEGARSLARGLSPVSVERGGLPSALRALATRATDMYGAQVRFHSKIWPQLSLDSAACNHLYRIAQEAVNNAVKHGHATDIVIDLHAAGENVMLSVNDNGRGLAPNAALAAGMGMKIMHYRAAMLGGSVTVEPRAAGGVCVSCSCRQPIVAVPGARPADSDAQSAGGLI